MKRFFMRMHVFLFFYGILRNSTEFAFMKRFFIRMHVSLTEFYGICIYEEILYQNAYFHFFYGILRNPMEFAFMKRFFMRMHVPFFF